MAAEYDGVRTEEHERGSLRCLLRESEVEAAREGESWIEQIGGRTAVRALVGDIRALPVDQGWAVARVIKRGRVEFYSEPVPDVELLTGDLAGLLRARQVLFVLSVMNPTLKAERWPRLGRVATAEVPMVTEIQCWKRDSISGKLSIYAVDLEVPGDWSERPAAHDECVGLE